MNIKEGLYKVNQNIGYAQGHLEEAKKVQTELQREVVRREQESQAGPKIDKLSSLITEAEMTQNCSLDGSSYAFYDYIIRALKVLRGY